MSRKRGRPSNLETPAVNWEYVDAVLVGGEATPDAEGRLAHGYPSQKALADRAGVSRSAVSQHVARHGTAARRKHVTDTHTGGMLLEAAVSAGRVYTPDGPDPMTLGPVAAPAAPFTPVARKTSRAITQTQTTQIEKALVHGVVSGVAEDLSYQVEYPTHEDVAAEYQISVAAVDKIAREGRCMERRTDAQDALRVDTDAVMTETRKALLDNMQDAVLGITTEYLTRFQEILANEKPINMTVNDVDKLVRLSLLLQGKPDAHTKVDGVFSLQDIQERHALYAHGEDAEDIEDAEYEEI